MKPTAEQVRAARMAAGLTQQACAKRLDYSLTGWQKKEDGGPTVAPCLAVSTNCYYFWPVSTLISY